MGYEDWNEYGGAANVLELDSTTSNSGASSLKVTNPDSESFLVWPISETDAPMEAEIRGFSSFTDNGDSPVGACYFRVQDVDNHYGVFCVAGNTYLYKCVNTTYTRVDYVNGTNYADDTGGRVNYSGWDDYSVIFWEDDNTGYVYARVFVAGQRLGRDLQDRNPPPELQTGGGVGIGAHQQANSDTYATWWLDDIEIYY